VIGRVTYERFGESWAWWAEPAGFEADRKVTFCLGCHGAGGWVTAGEGDWLRQNAGGRDTIARLAERGFLVGMSHAGGDTWGNPQAQADSLALVEAMRRRHNLRPKIVIFGRSMGGPLAVNLTLGRLAGQVDRLALLQPVVDLTGRIRRKPADSLLEAYGNPAVEEWPDTVARFCPLTQMRAYLALGTAGAALPPTEVWHNRGDPVCRIELTEQFVSLWRQAGGLIDLHALDGEGHTVYGQDPVATEVAAFLSHRLEE